MQQNEPKNEYPALSENDMKPAETAQNAPADSAPPAEREATEDFDYVIPSKRKKHRHKKHRKKKKSASGQPSVTDESADGFVFVRPSKKRKKHRHHRRHKKKKPLWLRILIIVVSVILALAIIITSTYFILKQIGHDAMHDYGDIDISIPLQDESGKDAADILDKGRTIRYGGKTYRLNEDIMTVTFIGFKDETDIYGSNMADAIYIAAIDDHTGKTTILGISRDTMLDVDLYSTEGKLIGSEKKQLSYAYSYGNDTVKGGANLNTSLSRLFFGLPFNNYFAIDLNALKDLNDAVGGVTLTSKMEFESTEYGRTIHEGEEITLKGDDAVKYVQSRDITDLKSNNKRMDRQQQYIMAFMSSIVPAAKKDISTVSKLYGVVSENADSTLDLPKVTYLATAALTKMKKASDIEYVRLDGKIKKGEFAELYTDDKNVLETMLKIFYTPVE